MGGPRSAGTAGLRQPLTPGRPGARPDSAGASRSDRATRAADHPATSHSEGGRPRARPGELGRLVVPLAGDEPPAAGRGDALRRRSGDRGKVAPGGDLGHQVGGPPIGRSDEHLGPLDRRPAPRSPRSGRSSGRPADRPPAAGSRAAASASSAPRTQLLGGGPGPGPEPARRCRPPADAAEAKASRQTARPRPPHRPSTSSRPPRTTASRTGVTLLKVASKRIVPVTPSSCRSSNRRSRIRTRLRPASRIASSSRRVPS